MPDSPPGSRLPGAVVVGIVLAAVLAAAAVVLFAARGGARPTLPPSADSPWPAPGAPVDGPLAAAGEAIFARDCAACHALGGGPGVGPDLAGVLDRRSPAWIRGMILEPDSMFAADAEARALLAAWGTPMRDTGLDERGLRAVIEHLRAGEAGR